MCVGLVAVLILPAVLILAADRPPALPALVASALRFAERDQTARTSPAAIEEYWILLRALGGSETSRSPQHQALARVLLADRDLPAVLPELLRGTTAEQRRLLAKALGRAEDVRIVPFLISLLHDDEVALWVQSALAEVGEPAAQLLWAAIPEPPEAAAFSTPGGRPRTVAQWCQSAFSQMGPRAVPFLVERLRHGEAGERRKALDILAWMHYSTFDLTDWPPEVRANLRRALDAPDSATRMNALRVLGWIEDPRAVESHGRRMLRDTDRHVALVAESLLRDGGVRQPCPLEAGRVSDLLHTNDMKRAGDFMRALIGVHKGYCDRDLAAALIPVLQDERKEARGLAIEGLSATVSLAARRALGAALSIEPDSELRAKILDAGVADPAATVLPLLDGRDSEQASMIEALGRLRVRAAVPALVRRLRHDTLAIPAATALAEIGDPAALPSLIEAFERTPSADLQRRSRLLGSIETCGGLDGVQFLGRVLLGSDQSLSIIAAGALARVVGPFGRLEMVRVLVQPIATAALKNPDTNVRTAVVEVLQAVEDSARLAALVREDPDIEVRIRTRDALSSLCDPNAVRVLAAWLSDRDRRLRTEAVWALSHHRRCEWDAAFTAVLWNEAGPPLVALLNGDDEELAAGAGSALAWIHQPAGLDAIIQAFERRPALRLRLAYALYNYGRAAEKAVPALMTVRPTAAADLARAIDQILRMVEQR